MRNDSNMENTPSPISIISLLNNVILLNTTCIVLHVGDSVGDTVGAIDGAMDGAINGANGGAIDGANDGANDRANDGANVGATDGAIYGANDGAMDGANDGANDGAIDGDNDGANDGAIDGANDGGWVGAKLGAVGINTNSDILIVSSKCWCDWYVCNDDVTINGSPTNPFSDDGGMDIMVAISLLVDDSREWMNWWLSMVCDSARWVKPKW